MTDTHTLHIVHVISGLGQGGAETVLHRLIAADGQRHRHTVISMTGEGVFGARLRAAGAVVNTLDMPAGRLSLGGLWRLHRLLRTLAPDVVQTWMYHADLIGGIMARLAGIRAVSWGIRNSGASLEKSSRVARAVAWTCARLSGVVPAVVVACAADAAKRHRDWGYRADRMQVIPNGYDLSRWKPDAGARARLREQWGIGAAAPVIGSIARWNPLKDHANLIEAFARCAAVRPDMRCVLVGLDMDAGNAELGAMLDRWNVRGKVVLLGMREDVPDVMNALDIHVLSSCAEGFPNVVAEAVATEVACVVTDVGDAALIVGDDGWVAPPRNALALAGAIEQALEELGTPQMQLRRRQGRERVGRLYGLQAMVDAYDAVWQGLARKFPRRTGAARPAAVQAAQTAIPPEAAGAAPKILLFTVNNPAFFLSHRLPIALGAARSGYEVHVATMDGAAVRTIQQHGFVHHVIPMSRSGKNPLRELLSIYALWRLYRRLRPDIVHAVTIKPVLYGGIAARLAGVPAYVAAISGLGFIFTRQQSRFDFLLWATMTLYRFALGHSNSRVIFQNENDRDLLARAGALKSGQAVMIRGSGVDLERFNVQAEPDGAPVAVMAARLLKDKGVREFVAAARISVGHSSGLRWMLAGSPDPGNPASVSQEDVEIWKREGFVECLGEQADIAALYRRSHIVVLPSYREGLPKSLVEAAACGRAVVTTDVPGCRDAIEPGVTGLLVPVHDAAALAAAVQRLADDAVLRRAMGSAGRNLAEREFDIRLIVGRHLEIYGALSAGGRKT